MKAFITIKTSLQNHLWALLSLQCLCSQGTPNVDRPKSDKQGTLTGVPSPPDLLSDLGLSIVVWIVTKCC